MWLYVAKRFAYMAIILALISFVSFIIINLPPGSWIDTYAIQLESGGTPATAEQLRFLTERYGLDLPLYLRYFHWIVPLLLHGDFGYSFEWQLPVSTLIADRMVLTVAVSLASLVFVYAVSIPIALYSATHQYTFGDYLTSFLGIVGLATPNFLLALVLLVASARLFGFTPTGLFSTEYLTAPWSAARVLDLVKHLPVPIVVVGVGGTAATIRILRAQLLDEIHKQYVTTARAKGLSETRLLLKYPFRMALNPIVSTIGTMLPAVISGSTIVAIVLGLPTTGPLLLRALVAQDTYVAASCLMLLGALTVIGVFLSDLLLMWLDPRIRLERAN